MNNAITSGAAMKQISATNSDGNLTWVRPVGRCNPANLARSDLLKLFFMAVKVVINTKFRISDNTKLTPMKQSKNRVKMA